MRFKPLLSAALLTLALCAGCSKAALSSDEFAYVSAPQAFLRDKVSAVYNKVGTIQNGERVTVLAHDRRFVRIRTAQGVEGWVEQRFLVDQSIYNQLEDLAKKTANAPVQARAAVRNDVNMHVSPGRDSEKLFQLKENEKLDLLQRAVTRKNAVTKVATPIRRAKPSPTKKPELKEASAKKNDVELPPLPTPPRPPAIAYEAAPMATDDSLTPTKPTGPDLGPPEDWWLVRDSHGRVGWVLGRMLDVDAPLEIAQYAEGKRIVAAYVLNTVTDEASDKPNHQVPYYLMLTNEPHDGEPQDFNALRVFTWNTKHHRYETAYREHDLNGVLPASVSKEDFGTKDGTLPTFTIRQRDDNGAITQKKYRMEGVIVKRVYAPGEQPPSSAARRLSASTTPTSKHHPKPRHRRAHHNG